MAGEEEYRKALECFKIMGWYRDDDVPPSKIPLFCVKESRIIGRTCFENPDFCATVTWEEIQDADILIERGGVVELYYFTPEVKKLINKYFPKPS